MPIQKGPANLGAGSVDSTELASTLDLSAKTVTYRTIVAGDIAADAITSVKIQDAAITNAKLAANGFDASKFTTGIVGDTLLDAVSASKLTGSRTIPKATLPTGNVLQLVQSNSFSGVSTTSGSTQFSSSTPSITPTSASSKLLLLWSPSIIVDTDNDSQGSNNGFVRFEYQIGGTGGSWSLLEQANVPSRGGNGTFTHACQLISPATTSAVYFRIGIGKLEGARVIQINDSWGSNRLTMMEIAA